MKYLVANWKSNLSKEEITQWCLACTKQQVDQAKLTVIVCPPLPYLEHTKAQLEANSIPFKLGSQDVSPFPKGSYTGAASASMVREYAEYSIVGHSERRQYFKESVSEVSQKVDQCRENNLTPILCLDVSYAQEQLSSLSDTNKVILVHEPISAISSNPNSHPDSPEHASTTAKHYKTVTTPETPVLYGGSVNPSNAGEYLIQEAIDGALVGSASLDANKWCQLIDLLSNQA